MTTPPVPQAVIACFLLSLTQAQARQASWSDAFPSGDVPGAVYAMATFDDDGPGARPLGLYLAGQFADAAGVAMNSIARWDGRRWEGLGPGLRKSGSPPSPGLARAMAAFDDDGPGPNPAALYVAGDFDMAGNMAGGNVARWDGSDWTLLGTGSQALGGTVYALAVFDDDGAGPNPPRLYAGGCFSGPSFAGVARWNGLAWEGVGGGVPAICGTPHIGVFSLAVFDPDGPGPIPEGLYAGGRFGFSPGGVPTENIARWSNGTWTSVGVIVGPSPAVNALHVHDDDGPGPRPPALYAGGSFFYIDGTQVSSAIARFDGSGWSSVGPVTGSGATIAGLSQYDPDGPGPAPPVLVAVGKFAALGGTPAQNAAFWDGASWSAMGTGINGSTTGEHGKCVTSFDPDGAGPGAPLLYVGGALNTAGDFNVINIANWDGSTWFPVGNAIGPLSPAPRVLAMTVHDDDAGGPRPPALYLAGEFRHAGRTAPSNIARWDGRAWETLAAGTNARVRALAVFDPDGPGPQDPVLIAGGAFTTAGSVTASRIAAWNGTAWSTLGAGVSGEVRALAAFDEDDAGPAPPVLYVGGGFAATPGVSPNLARWNGSAWTPLAQSVNGTVHAFQIHDDDGGGPGAPALYVGGAFTAAGATTLNRIARWDGAQWAALGTGMNADVRALAVFDSDGPGPNPPQLFACGQFSTAGGIPAGRIARWTGTTWTSVGVGTTGEAYALLVHDPDGPGPSAPGLVLGGFFTSIGGAAAANLAVWNGSTWTPLGSGVNKLVNSLALFADPGAGSPALFVGGEFSIAGGLSSGRVARWGYPPAPGCYPDCNGDLVLNLADFGCFQTKFATGDPYADCNGDGALNLADFGCFQTRFAVGCP